MSLSELIDKSKAELFTSHEDKWNMAVENNQE